MWQLKLKRKDGTKFSYPFDDIENAKQCLTDERRFNGANGFIRRNK